MAGISPKLPLTFSKTDGYYTLNKTFKDMAKQNLKMLVLTAPGERMMDPDFGIGIRNFLFDPRPETIQLLSKKITQQTKRYLSYIIIEELQFFDLNELDEQVVLASDLHTLGLKIFYYIQGLNAQDILEITGLTNN